MSHSEIHQEWQAVDGISIVLSVHTARALTADQLERVRMLVIDIENLIATVGGDE